MEHVIESYLSSPVVRTVESWDFCHPPSKELLLLSAFSDRSCSESSLFVFPFSFIFLIYNFGIRQNTVTDFREALSLLLSHSGKMCFRSSRAGTLSLMRTIPFLKLSAN